MQATHDSGRREETDVIVEERPELTDVLLGLYCDWRTRCEDVRTNYDPLLERTESGPGIGVRLLRGCA